MQEAVDLMAALRRLIDLEEAVHAEYEDAAIGLMDAGQVEFGVAVFRAGSAHNKRALALRAELVDLLVKHGRSSAEWRLGR